MPFEDTLSYNRSRTLFFDFYVMNELWFKTIGQQEFGYTEYKILPYSKERIIDETFREILSEMKCRVISCLESSVRGEIRHLNRWGPSALDGDHQAVYGLFGKIPYKVKKRRKEVKKLCKTYGHKKSVWPLEIIHHAFMMKGWDGAFGGKKWGKGAELLMKLKNSKSINTDIFYIDQIWDLVHNNGFILNKTYFKYLEYRFGYEEKLKYKIRQCNPLNFRFTAETSKMVNLCSPKIYKIYMANRNFIDGTLQNLNN